MLTLPAPGNLGGGPGTPARYDLDDLKARTDLAALVADYAGQGRWSGRTVTFRCPSPDHPDNTPSFTVDTSTGRYRCWSRCGSGLDPNRSGDAVDLLVWLEGITAGDAITRLAARAGLSPSTSTLPAPRRPKSRPAPKAPTEADDTGTRRPPADAASRILSRFCAGRGWSMGTAATAGLSVVLDDRNRPRVRFPFTAAGRLYGWQDRLAGPGQPRWLSPSGAITVPFRMDSLRGLEAGSLVVVTEGPADCCALLDTFPELPAVGLPGTGAWQPHWSRSFAGLVVVIAADLDPAGDSMRDKLAADLDGIAAGVADLYPPGDDLDAWHREDPEGFASGVALTLHNVAASYGTPGPEGVTL